ncbi:MAG TPA: ABC transporter transmembrane domain-containing protein, partial [Microthrixaceae bacterium]|nr:ABC transporter transmembrane domain-containing protein [Microthrixaceae bacterium]
MLKRLATNYLRPYKRLIVFVLLFQLIATIANLTLPSLNAAIIDNGVAKNDNGYIWRHGGIMLAVSLVQVVFSILAVYYGSRASMGLGRDVRHDLFHQVTGFSSREVNELGAPSLITRITNDVTQVQTLVQMTCTMFIAAPIMAVG